MKNLKKLSRVELRSLNGGIFNCAGQQTIPGVPKPECPCRPGYHRCNGVCISNTQIC